MTGLRRFIDVYPERSAFEEPAETRVGHCRSDETDLYIGRHGPDGRQHMLNTPVGDAGWLGNPFPVEALSREESIAKFCEVLVARVDSDAEFRRALV